MSEKNKRIMIEVSFSSYSSRVFKFLGCQDSYSENRYISVSLKFARYIRRDFERWPSGWKTSKQNEKDECVPFESIWKPSNS